MLQVRGLAPNTNYRDNPSSFLIFVKFSQQFISLEGSKNLKTTSYKPLNKAIHRHCELANYKYKNSLTEFLINESRILSEQI